MPPKGLDADSTTLRLVTTLKLGKGGKNHHPNWAEKTLEDLCVAYKYVHIYICIYIYIETGVVQWFIKWTWDRQGMGKIIRWAR